MLHASNRSLTLLSLLRWLLLVGYVAVVYAAILGAGLLLWPSGRWSVALSFLAAAISAAGVRPVWSRLDRVLARTLLHRTVTPYSALVTVAARLPAAGSVQQVLPALARVLAEGVGARRSSVWLLVDGKLMHAAAWPAGSSGPAAVADLAELRATPGVDHAVAILDGQLARGALAIGKSGPHSVTGEDDRLMRDAANSAGLLLRTVARNAELHDRLRQAEKLELELRASQERLLRARDVERRRLVTEIAAVTTGSLGVIRTELGHLRDGLADSPATADRVLARLRPALDELIERFRAVVRGVYPGVLRDEGPRAALEEVAGDLPRPIIFTGQLGERVDWEVESGIYYAAAAAIQLLGRTRSDHPLRVRLGHEDGWLTVRVDDAAGEPSASAGLRAALANDVDRLAALGGGLRFEDSDGRLVVSAWLPDRLAPDLAERAVATPAIGQNTAEPGARTGRAETAPAAARQAPETAPSQAGAIAATRIPAPRGTPELGSRPLLARVRALVGAACERYADGPVGEALVEIASRLDEPLRVALVGRVKSGKSTLLNALVGQEIAATDATECTRLPTWYRHGARCQLTLYPREGPPKQLEFASGAAAGSVALGELAPEAVDRLVVDWPAATLRTMTLIDSPGLDSPSSAVTDRTRELLAPRAGGIAVADAVVYLMRHPHGGDVPLLAGVHRESAHGNPVAAVGVVSRVDELGSGGCDAVAAAQRLVDRHRHDPALRRLCQAVVPVAGLLAASGLTLHDAEYDALTQLAALDKRDTDRLLLSADDLTHADFPVEPGKSARGELLARFGIFGVRLAVELIRTGEATSRAALSKALLDHSGLAALRELLLARLAARADVLKARSALLAVDSVLASLPPTDPDRDALRYEIEQTRAGAHELVEIDLLDRLRDGVPRLSTMDADAAELLLGAQGPDPRSRLALSPECQDREVREAASAQLVRWQRLAENPAAPREAREIFRAAVRSCEGLLQP